MKINKIVLDNFGSYEGCTTFETRVNREKNIVLIGGKNGAGKTTLFTAMRLCLYGYKSMGYKSYNSYYIKSITKMINNNAKLSKPAKTTVSMIIELNNGQGIDTYTLKREWILTESLVEHFYVQKNDINLSEEDVADFEKYLMSLIPPELFNLYFFDGEKIADFFLDEGSSTRIKSAFLTLCGYDTFDIMKKNFKRISVKSKDTTPLLDKYIASKEILRKAEKNINSLEYQIKECMDNIHDCEASILAIEKDYHEKGGITEEQWNSKLFSLKEEEKKRENYNALLKKWANDMVPFLMLKKEIVELETQIKIENESQKFDNFCEVLDRLENSKSKDAFEILKNKAYKIYGNKKESFLNLSLEQKALVLGQIGTITAFDENKILKYKRAIKSSISTSAQLRKELETSSVSTVQEYMKSRAKLFEEKSALLVLRVELEGKLNKCKEELIRCEAEFTRIQVKLEEELKQASINDISSRAIVMLDKLQGALYRKQIAKVENLFRKNIKKLMRKTQFIDDIFIDDAFNVHIYRTDDIEVSKIINVLKESSETQIRGMLGTKAIQMLYQILNVNCMTDAIDALEKYDEKTLKLLVEIDKSSLSNGEKQIFIMTLYHALVSLCNHEIPFIIDTPFARIDTEHRKNISKHFFSKLNGQIFILSTNEEINSQHVQILKEKIAATYMLENSDNKKTTVIENIYFEV